MLKVKLECRNVRCEKIANLLSRFGETFPFGYKVWVYDDRVFAYFKVRSISDLNEITRQLKCIKRIEFVYHRIERSWI